MILNKQIKQANQTEQSQYKKVINQDYTTQNIARNSRDSVNSTLNNFDLSPL